MKVINYISVAILLVAHFAEANVALFYGDTSSPYLSQSFSSKLQQNRLGGSHQKIGIITPLFSEGIFLSLKSPTPDKQFEIALFDTSKEALTTNALLKQNIFQTASGFQFTMPKANLLFKTYTNTPHMLENKSTPRSLSSPVITTAAVSGQVNVTSKVTVGIESEIAKAQFNNTSDKLDNMQISVPLDVYYHVNDDTAVSMGYRRKDFIAHQNNLGITDHMLNMGVKTNVTEALQSEVKLGIQNRYQNNENIDQGIAASSQLRYKITDQTTIKSGFATDYATDSSGNSLHKTATSIDLDYSLSELILLGTQFTMYSFEDIQTGLEEERKDAELQLTVHPYEMFSFMAGYAYSVGNFDTDDIETTNHSLNFKASFSF